MTFVGMPAYALPTNVAFINEDIATGGNWLNAQGFLNRTSYGTCGHVLPGTVEGETGLGEISIGNVTGMDIEAFYLILNNYGEPYKLDNAQWVGMQYYNNTPPYYDEYVNPNDCFTYTVAGPKSTIPAVGEYPSINVQYPAFTYGWNDFHDSPQGDYRNAIYTTTMAGNDHANMWRLAAWDSGGEREWPNPDYFDFILTFTKTGTFLVSLYAYDYEMTSRTSETFQIWDSTATTLLASKQISGSVYDNGVYETFTATINTAPDTLVIRIYSDAGHPASVNTVLSGVFLECELGQACGLSPGFWKTNAQKDLGLLKGNAQVNGTTYWNLLKALWNDGATQPTMAAMGFTNASMSTQTAALTQAKNIFVAGEGGTDFQKAARQLLSILLTSLYVPNWSDGMIDGHTVAYWIAQLTSEFLAGNYSNSLLSTLSEDACLPYFT